MWRTKLGIFYGGWVVGRTKTVILAVLNKLFVQKENNFIRSHPD